MVACPEGIIDSNFVIIDKSILDGQSTSIGNAFKDLDFIVSQLYLSNNKLRGSQFATLLRSLSEDQRHDLKSIVYGGRNELNKDAYEALRDLYLCKRGPSTLLELKLIDAKIGDPGVLHAMLLDFSQEMRLQSLFLAKTQLEPRSVDLLIQILAKQTPSFRDLDISWNQISTKQMKTICETLAGNQYIRKLNLAFNPVSRTDDLKELGQFMRQNTSL